ncbi:hypothetical protein KAR91_50200 [Candidatus Pacearchaeota archaeon]|nr:hypothetical protein [Candidatus Pacearchaeota archaeon]
MSFFKEVFIVGADSPSVDAFARMRVSQPQTLFDSKLTQDNRPLLWDDQEISGASTSSTHDPNRASVALGVGASTSGTRVRQTKMRFNYQPGKSQLVVFTTILGAGATGITKRVGYFDSNDGLFLQLSDSTLSVVQRSNVTGSPIDTSVAQSNWNIDKLDGTGKSGITLNTSKAQIFFLDFKWLGTGRVRLGFFVDGQPFHCHEFLNGNSLDVVYMSTPNLPCRYEISNNGTGTASELEQICTTVISEGGSQDLGVLRYASTNGTHVDADVANTTYAVLGIRLKAAYLDVAVKLVSMAMVSETSDDFEWILKLNPTIAGTFTYTGETNSTMEVARGATSNTITGGINLGGGFASIDTLIATQALENSLLLGSLIDGTPDEIVLCVRPLSINADIQGSLTWRELL